MNELKEEGGNKGIKMALKKLREEARSKNHKNLNREQRTKKKMGRRTEKLRQKW
jgi:hypothetical protein